MIGYIKLHRQILEWEWYDDANAFRLFIHCLIKANHADKEWRGIKINRGQFHTSIGILAVELKLSDKAIRIAIDKLISTKEITTKGASNGTMITVCNYDTYQGFEDVKGRAKGQTRGERGATTNNDNNDKEEFLYTWRENFEIYKSELRDNYNILINDSKWINERQKYHPNLDVKLTIEKACKDFWATEAGWKNKKKSKTITIDWKATLQNALTLKSNQVYKQNGYAKQEEHNNHVY
jgi:hypothetical protein